MTARSVDLAAQKLREDRFQVGSSNFEFSSKYTQSLDFEIREFLPEGILPTYARLSLADRVVLLSNNRMLFFLSL